ncbi:hypothetical protein QIS74_01601 [Colletotrichum tabaci]|uniref:Carrier domain-containing protein n=1 Tax=Colletotrichum tabaci TaxID=1209068 RepID=A0AAV9TTY4_9PEZI
MKFFASLLAVAPLATSVMSLAVDKLDTRQNSCIGATYPVLSVNHLDRKEFQGEIDQRGSLGWLATPDVSVIFDFGATTPANPQLNFRIFNKNSATWKAVILSNYVDTITTPARETDALMHNRRAHGLKDTSINAGVVLGIGITAERGEIPTYLKLGAMIGVREKELLATVQAAMADEIPVHLTGFGDGRFAHLRIYDTPSFAVVNEDTTAELQAALAAATSLAEASELVCGALMRKLAKAMLIEIEDLNSSRPVNAYGVDRLVAVEVQTWVFKDVKSDVSVFDILSNVPVSQLAESIAAKSQLVRASVRNVENTKDL